MTTAHYTRFAWALLTLTLAVILWGAWVRLTGSGAGCGQHWPLCNGTVVPLAAEKKTLIEFTHRVTSGLVALGAVILFALARRRFAPTSAGRRAARWTLVFMGIEVLVGAVLVLMRLVEQDSSALRAFVIGAHLINSLLLVAALTLSARWADRDEPLQLLPGRGRTIMGGLFGLLLFVGATGAIAALGNTLFPAESLMHGLRQDLSPTSHFLLRLRTIHPLLAVFSSSLVLGVAFVTLLNATALRTRVLARLTITTVLAQVTLGFINLLLLAPAALQLAHLLLAELLVVVFVLLAEQMLCVRTSAQEHTKEAAMNGSAQLAQAAQG